MSILAWSRDGINGSTLYKLTHYEMLTKSNSCVLYLDPTQPTCIDNASVQNRSDMISPMENGITSSMFITDDVGKPFSVSDILLQVFCTDALSIHCVSKKTDRRLAKTSTLSDILLAIINSLLIIITNNVLSACTVGYFIFNKTVNVISKD